jgi:hypothetical protein
MSPGKMWIEIKQGFDNAAPGGMNGPNRLETGAPKMAQG